MVTIRDSKGDIIILGTRAESLILKVMDFAADSRFSPLTESEQEEAKRIIDWLK